MKGSTVHQKIKDTLHGAQAAKEKAQAEREALLRQANQANTQLREAIEVVARLRLQGGGLSGLRAADQKAARLAKQRQGKLDAISSLKSQAQAALATANEAFAAAKMARDSADARWEACKQQAYRGLEETSNPLRERLSRIKGREAQLARLAAFGQERAGLRETLYRKMQQDRLFAYLLERKCGQVDATGNALTRFLDGVVARHCGYWAHKQPLDEHARQMERLNAIGVRLSQAQDEDNEFVSQARQNALLAPDIQLVRDARDAAKVALAEAGVRQDNAQAQVLRLGQQLEQFDKGLDEDSRAARDILVEAITGARSQALIEAARETDSPEDDVAVGKIDTLREKISTLTPRIEKADRALEEATSTLARIEALQSNFKSRQYGGSRDNFRSSVNIDDLLTGVLIGRMSADSAWSSLSHGHYRDPEPTYSSPSHASSSSSSNSSSDSFSSGGGFGGGGGSFDTGGGF